MIINFIFYLNKKIKLIIFLNNKDLRRGYTSHIITYTNGRRTKTMMYDEKNKTVVRLDIDKNLNVSGTIGIHH